MIYLFYLVLFLFSIYSYSLIDPNITFFQNSLWVWFRDIVVYFGYYQRQYSWFTYLFFIVVLFGFYFYFVRNYKKISIFRLACVVAGVCVLSYPFLSHDFFNYMFDAKIFTFYGKNPYLFKALDFPLDPWTRFMHWTHRTYPYGPIFLVLSFIPSYFGFGKFAVTFFLFKGWYAGCYLLAVYYLRKLDKKAATIFALHPLIIIEGLMNCHNDLIGLSLGIVGIYLLIHNKHVFGRIVLLCSVGIKYITLPILFFVPHKKWSLKLNALLFFGQAIAICYLSYRMSIQPWYFLSLFLFLPFFQHIFLHLSLFFFGLLISYYPYIRLGGWDTSGKVDLKHMIIFVCIALNVLYFFFRYIKKYFRPSHVH